MDPLQINQGAPLGELVQGQCQKGEAVEGPAGTFYHLGTLAQIAGGDELFRGGEPG